MVGKAAGLHREAHEKCFIASSVNFPVHHRPVILVAGQTGPDGQTEPDGGTEPDAMPADPPR